MKLVAMLNQKIENKPKQEKKCPFCEEERAISDETGGYFQMRDYALIYIHDRRACGGIIVNFCPICGKPVKR